MISPDAQKQLLALPKSERAAVLLGLLEIGSAFGHPHVHGGLGIRKLRANLFECRAGLSLRVVFWYLPDGLWISLIGNHDDVKKYLRTF
jgi:hypothetical protein